MKKYDDFDEKPVRAKRPKHSKNRPGEGMRVLNRHALEQGYYLDLNDDVEVEDYTDEDE